MGRRGSRVVATLLALPWAQLALLLSAMIATAAIVLLILRVGTTNDHRERALARERHAFEVLFATRSIQASMASAESALGRYAISADRLMGSTYSDEWRSVGGRIRRLQALVARDRVTAALSRRLEALYVARGRELSIPAASVAAHRPQDAIAQFSAAGRSPRIDAIRAVLDDIQDSQRTTLERRADQSQAAADSANHLVSMLSLVGLLLVAVAGTLGWLVSIVVGRARRVEAQAEEAGIRAAWLREAVEERTAELSDANRRLQSEIAERTAVEAQIRQMQKMDAVGKLTGGIAHDFNNMLAVVIGSLDLARRRLGPVHGEVSGHIDHAMDGAERAAQLTRRLLGFARAEPLLPQRVDPEAAIEGMGELFDRTLGERITVRTRIARNCWPVWVDPIALENALLNLAVNGRDAMQGDGTLVISASNIALPADTVATLGAGDYVRIAIGDSGDGMPSDVIERAFEPFFTTKPIGEGTGLGLSQVFGFVRESGGDVTIDSAIGRGTTVSLYLPRTAAPAASPTATVHTLPLPVRDEMPRLTGQDAEPILLVEDDARVRAATAEALVELGYRPVSCAGAAEALEMLALTDGLRLMITDVVMPETTGPELAQIVRAERPDLAVLFVTGYAGDEGGDLLGETVLRKPFTIAGLDAAVAGALARAPAAGVSRVSGPPLRAAVAAAG